MILVATDVAARGLDIDNIDVIIQSSVKNTDSFVHRTGRTGRAGKKGRNIVLFDVTTHDPSQLDFFKKLEKALKCDFKVSNAITNEGPDSSEDHEQIQEAKVLKKIKYLSEREPAKALNQRAVTQIDELMHWFVDLEAN